MAFFSSTRLLLCLYAGSGLLALSYEVLWTRILGLWFGVSIFGVVVTIAAFMAGLGLGAYGSSRVRSLSPLADLRLFAVLEAAVALFSLSLPWLVKGLDAVLLPLLAHASLAAWMSAEGLLALLLLLLPAMALGWAFPLVLRLADQLGSSLASIYGVNALGATLGALLPLCLLPVLGWQSSLYVVSGLGLLLALLIYSSGQRLGLVKKMHDQSWFQDSVAWADVLAYALVGMAALMLEVVWIRIFGMLMLRTEYVMALILAAYLMGIGFGSLLAKRLQSSWALSLLPVLIACYAFLGLYALPLLVHLQAILAPTGFYLHLLVQACLLLAFTLPITLALGAWLPLLAQRLGHQNMGASLYAFNSLGAALGAVLAGVFLIPALGSAGVLCVSMLLLLLASLRWCRPWVYAVLPLFFVLAWFLRTLAPATLLSPSLQADQDLWLHEDAVSLTHIVQQPNGQLLLLSDLQRMDASSDPTAVVVQRNQGRLPLLLHGQPHSVLFLGLGTGVTASSALAWPKLEIRAVELSAGAIRAACDDFSPVNGSICKHADIVHDDVRRFLKRDQHHYDVIIGDLFHPDMVGRAALLSQQQFQRAKDHLHEGGFFVQWLALNQFDAASLAVVMRSFARVFEHGSIFVDGFRVALLGRKDKALSFRDSLQGLSQLSAQQRLAVTGGEGLYTWYGRYAGAIPLTEGRVQSEWSPVIEYELPRTRSQFNLAEMLFWMIKQRPVMTQVMRDLAVPAGQQVLFAAAYSSTSWMLRSWLAELSMAEPQASTAAWNAYRVNKQNRWAGFAVADRMLQSIDQSRLGLTRAQSLQRILAIRPDHVHAMRLLLPWAQQHDVVLARHLTTELHKLDPLGVQ